MNSNISTTSNSKNSSNDRNTANVNDHHMNTLLARNPQQQTFQHLHPHQQQKQQEHQYPSSQFQHQQLQMQMLQQQQQKQHFQQPIHQTHNYQSQPTAPVASSQQLQQHLLRSQQQQQQNMQPEGTTASPTPWLGVQQQAGNNALAQEIGQAVALALANVNFSRINPDMQGFQAQTTISPITPVQNENFFRLTIPQQIQQNLLTQQHQKQQQQMQQHYQNHTKSKLEMFSTKQLQRQPTGSQPTGSCQPLLVNLAEQPTCYSNDTAHDTLNTPYFNLNIPATVALSTPFSFNESPLRSKIPTASQSSQQAQFPLLPGAPIDVANQQFERLDKMDANHSLDRSFEMGSSGWNQRNSTAKNYTTSAAFRPAFATENIKKPSDGKERKIRRILPRVVASASGFHSDLDAELFSGSNQGQSTARSSTTFFPGLQASMSASGSNSTLPLMSVNVNNNISTPQDATPTPLSNIATNFSHTATSRQSTPATNSTKRFSDSPFQYRGLLTAIITLVLENQYQKTSNHADFGQAEPRLSFEAVIQGLEDRYSTELLGADSRAGRGVWKTDVLDILQNSAAFTRHVHFDAKSGDNIIYYQISPEIQERALEIVGAGKIFAPEFWRSGTTISERTTSITASKQRRPDAQQDEILNDIETDEEYKHDLAPNFDDFTEAARSPDSGNEPIGISGKEINEETFCNASDIEESDHGIDPRLQASIGRGKSNPNVIQTPLQSSRKRKWTNELGERRSIYLPAEQNAIQLSFSPSSRCTSSAAPLLATSVGGSVVPSFSVQEHSRDRVTIQPTSYAGTTSQAFSTVGPEASKLSAQVETTGASGTAGGSKVAPIFWTSASASSQRQHAVASQPPPPKSALVRNPTLYDFPTAGSETDNRSGGSQKELIKSVTDIHLSVSSEALPKAALAALQIPATYEKFNVLNSHGSITTASDPFPSGNSDPSLPTTKTNEPQIEMQQLIDALMTQDRRIKIQQAQLQYAAWCVSDMDTTLKKYREREEVLIKWIMEREKKFRLSSGMVRTCWENGKRRQEINAMRMQQDENFDSAYQSREQKGIEIDEMWKWMNVLWKVVGVNDMDVPMDPEMEMEIKMREMKMSLRVPSVEKDESWVVGDMEVEVERLLVGNSGSVEMGGGTETGTEILKEIERNERSGEDEEINEEKEDNEDEDEQLCEDTAEDKEDGQEAAVKNRGVSK